MAYEYFKKFDDQVYANGQDGNKKILRTIKSYNYSSAYGSTAIDSTKGEKWIWTYRILGTNTGKGIYIGLSSTLICDQDCFTNRSSSNYCYASNGQKWSKGRQGRLHNKGSVKAGDIVTQILDLRNRTLQYIYNGEDLGYAYDGDIDVREGLFYYQAIIMAKQGDDLELLEFRQDNIDLQSLLKDFVITFDYQELADLGTGLIQAGNDNKSLKKWKVSEQNTKEFSRYEQLHHRIQADEVKYIYFCIHKRCLLYLYIFPYSFYISCIKS